MIAVSSGLVASLGLQATAAPASPPVTTAVSGSATVTSTAASAVPSVLTVGQFGEIGFTATTAPAPAKPKAEPNPEPAPEPQRAPDQAREAAGARPFSQVSRSSSRSDEPSGETSSPAEESSPAPASIKAGAPGSAEFGAAALSIAARYAGIAYRYGGTTPAGFDCSGFTSYVLAQVGVDLPRTSSAQRAATARISRSEAVPGDLVFMPGHVGIYAGNGMMWDSPRAGEDVAKRPVYSSSATYGRIG